MSKTLYLYIIKNYLGLLGITKIADEPNDGILRGLRKNRNVIPWGLRKKRYFWRIPNLGFYGILGDSGQKKTIFGHICSPDI